MKLIEKYITAGTLLAGTASFIWFGLLDKRARKSVRETASAMHKRVLEYYESNSNQQSPKEKEQILAAHQAWVQEQWKQAGY